MTEQHQIESCRNADKQTGVQTIQELTQAIEKAPTVLNYAKRAAAYLEAGEYDFALQDTAKCVELNAEGKAGQENRQRQQGKEESRSIQEDARGLNSQRGTPTNPDTSTVQRTPGGRLDGILSANRSVTGTPLGKGATLAGKQAFEHVLDAARSAECICGDQKADSLEEAVEKECIRCCARYIDEAKTYDKMSGSESALMKVAKRGLVDFVQLLLYYQKDLTDRDGKKAGDYACLVENAELWKLFPEQISEDYILSLLKAHTASCCCDGCSQSLFEAVERGCLKCCAKYIDQVGRHDEKDHDNTALIKAAILGSTDIVLLLMHREARQQNGDGETALILAVKENRFDIAQILSPYEAKMQSKNGWTALMAAAYCGFLNAVKLLMPCEAKMHNGDGETALMLAAQNNHADIVKLLILYEATLHDKKGWTALMVAAQEGHADVCKMLIPYEAQMHNREGETALMQAAKHGHLEVVKLLEAQEATQQDKDGLTALMQAALSNHVEIIKLLTPKEAKMQSEVGKTALMWAVQEGNLDAIRLLVLPEEKQQDKDGMSALIMAAMSGNLAAVKLLVPVEKGLKDAKGRNALYHAFQKDESKCVELLWEVSEEKEGLDAEALKKVKSQLALK